MPAPNQVAGWMLEEIEQAGILLQTDVVEYLQIKYGEGTYVNPNGHRAISKSILLAFSKLRGDGVVWVRAAHYWRKRQIGDEPGRQQ